MSDVIDNKAESRFELGIDGSMAVAEYRIVESSGATEAAPARSGAHGTGAPSSAA